MKKRTIFVVYSVFSDSNMHSTSFKVERCYTSRLSAFSYCELMNKHYMALYDFVEVPLFGVFSKKK